MNSIRTSRFPGEAYAWPDFVITFVVAVLAAVAVWAINLTPSFYGVHAGLVLDFVFLVWLGFGVVQTPARWWGDLVVIATTLGSFFVTVQSRFQADWVVALPLTFLAAFSICWGFSEGMKKLNEWERQRLDREINDIVGTLFFSTLGFLVLCGSARIPYAGLPLAIATAFFLGVGLGYIELPVWSQVTVAILSSSGSFFGLKWQLEPSPVSEVAALLGTCMGLCVFFVGFLRGVRRAMRENEREVCVEPEQTDHSFFEDRKNFDRHE